MDNVCETIIRMQHHPQETALIQRAEKESGHRRGAFRISARRRRAFAGVCGAAAILAATALRAQSIVPEALPDPKIPGFHFPESEATLTGWITDMTRGTSAAGATSATARVYGHGWGLWTALTMDATQSYERQKLHVFETWLTPDELADDAGVPGVPAATSLPRQRTTLRQIGRLQIQAGDPADGDEAVNVNAIDRVMGLVKLDPTAADHIVKQQLLTAAALDMLLQGGAQNIPAFPATAFVVKPVFQIIRARDLIDGRYYRLKVWPGPPAIPQAWSPSLWPDCVWIDVFGGGNGHGAVDPLAEADGSTRSDDTTYPLASLINHRLSASDAAALNLENPANDATAGDYAILVAMHAAGREIARWTWQTFWWTPTPDDPHEPSSPAIASSRPAQLRGAPRNYAMALAYTMLTPDQPYVGGENVGTAVYAYNPWIEAHFGPADLPDSLPVIDASGRAAGNNYGVQTNCMSCHVRATYNPNHRSTAPRFSGARYTDLGDPQFVGTLQVDFLWLIARHAR
jgi:hypothetical protein